MTSCSAARGVVCVHEEMPRLRTIHHGIRIEDYAFKAQKQPYLAFLGRMAPVKGPHLAIEVAKRAGACAGQRVDEMAREYGHEEVGGGRAEQAAGDGGRAAGLLQPVAEHEGQHDANGGGPIFSLGGHGVIRLRSTRRLHLNGREAAATGRTRASYD